MRALTWMAHATGAAHDLFIYLGSGVGGCYRNI